MFSIGAIMCEMLTGWHPFYTPNVDDAQSVQAQGPCRRMSGCQLRMVMSHNV